MITVNIRYIRILKVENAASVNIGTTLNIVAQAEGEKGKPEPSEPPRPVVPPSPPPREGTPPPAP